MLFITERNKQCGTHDRSTFRISRLRKIYASVDAFLEDFNEAYEIVLEATGKAPDIYRFPGGSVNDYNEKARDDIIAEMDRRGFTYFDWNVDSNDWQGYGWTTLYTNVLKDAEEFSSPVILSIIQATVIIRCL